MTLTQHSPDTFGITVDGTEHVYTRKQIEEILSQWGRVVWPELKSDGPLRFLANEKLARENGELREMAKELADVVVTLSFPWNQEQEERVLAKVREVKEQLLKGEK